MARTAPPKASARRKPPARKLPARKLPARKLGAAAQRRLDDLITRSKSHPLTAAEQRELEAILDGVDRESFWMLARRVIARRTKHAAAPLPLKQA